MDRVETMLSDEEKALVEKTDGRVYIESLMNDEDKDKVEALLSIDEFLTLLEVKQNLSKGLHHEVNFSKKKGERLQNPKGYQKREKKI